MAKRIKYTYDPLALIELVEQRPCIWDKAGEEYKDRVKKSKSWREIYNFVIDDFENMEEEEQLTAGKAVNEKWKHIRDAFTTSLKKKSGDKRTKKYIYSDQLQFLLKIVEKDETESSIADNVWIEQGEDEETSSLNTDHEPGTSVASSRKCRGKNSYEEVDKALLKALEATSQTQVPAQLDEDTAFFTSVTPSVKNFSEDEKLEFRIGVPTLIKNIKDKKLRPQFRPISRELYSDSSPIFSPPPHYGSNQNMYGNQNTNVYENM